MNFATFRYMATLLALCDIVLTATPANAQSSGAVPATCTINASGTSLTCTTTVTLSGVSGTFSGGSLTVTGAAAGPQCNGGLTASPTSISANTATAISLQACPSNTNRSSLNFRWVSPATQASGSDAWFGSATATLGAGASINYSVDVCDSAAANAACTRVTSPAITAAGGTFTCSSITPSATQSVVVGSSATALTANCSGATSYQWYIGASPSTGTAISGATAQSYVPPTSSVGSTAYSVRATNANQQTADSPNSVTVNVSQQQTGGCPAGEPRIVVAYSRDVLNFTKQTVIGNGMHITQVNVLSSDSSIGKQYPPSFGYSQDDTTAYSNRTISVSPNCGDFTSGSAQIVRSGFPTGTIKLVTAGDSRSGSPGHATVGPGTWYINLRNDSCDPGVNCSFTGIYRNFNF
jgi:hypothetical protein